MSAIPPLAFDWTGDVMSPKQPRLADRYYVVGEVYRLAPQEDRSAASHRHFFAAVNEAHNNLPEDLAERFPSPDHLRKFALVKAGYRDERSIACGSKAEAINVAAFIRPMDSFAIVTVQGVMVTVYTAKSQSMRTMGKKVFQESKDAVLRVLSEMIGTDVGTLQASASRAA